MHHVCACVSCMTHMASLGFTYNVDHVIMMSSAFVFHLCHVGMRWHDVIGVHIASTPQNHGLLRIGMM